MPELFENGLFIFRRDLRITDNNGLIALNSQCKNIYPVFIFTPEQIENNSYKSYPAVQFMMESLQDLEHKIEKMGGKLLLFYGKNDDIVAHLIQKLHINVVAFNTDCTPYAIKRDHSIQQLCASLSVKTLTTDDYYLQPLGSVLNQTEYTYQKFTPFYNAALQFRVAAPIGHRKIRFARSSLHNITLSVAVARFVDYSPNVLRGGRDAATKQIRIALRNTRDYGKTHNILIQPTSQLSAYIKFGCVSIREVYHIFHSNRDFIRQLYWRDFYANIAFAYPHVFGATMKPKYDKIRWTQNHGWFTKWCNGTTGFPIVDAGMRELNHTGYMHNRARLITMSFLCKTLMIDWRLGERYFASKLVDYDPASNNGNIQWVMGGGSDSNPYFRIFNPWLQTAEYDANCEYIRKWVPELRDVPIPDILRWNTEHPKYAGVYKIPIVDYTEHKERALRLYRSALE